MYFVDEKPNAQLFEGYLAQHPRAIDLWLGGHTHTFPDDVVGGRSHIEQKCGASFINVLALTRYHSSNRYRWEGLLPNVPMSRLFTFTDGSADVKVRCYLHSSDYAAQGWYQPAERLVQLNKPFQFPLYRSRLKPKIRA